MGEKLPLPTSQKEEVIYYLKKHGRITTMDAYILCIADLQGIIRDLRKEMVIHDEWVYKKNIYGRPIRFKRYYIEPEDRLSLFERLRYFM